MAVIAERSLNVEAAGKSKDAARVVAAAVERDLAGQRIAVASTTAFGLRTSSTR
jgi:hypothetical protein